MLFSQRIMYRHTETFEDMAFIDTFYCSTVTTFDYPLAKRSTPSSLLFIIIIIEEALLEICSYLCKIPPDIKEINLDMFLSVVCVISPKS